MPTPDESRKERVKDCAQAEDCCSDDGVRDLQIRGVAHDVRQMLGIISGRAGLLLKRDQVAAAGRSDLQAIAQAAEDAAAMLMRLPGGGPSPDVRGTIPTFLAPVIRQVMTVVQPPDGLGWVELKAGSVCPEDRWGLCLALREDIEVGVPAQILREVLANLVLNALEAMPRGGTLTFSVLPGTDSRILTVADTGPGFAGVDPEEYFRQGKSSRRQPGRGVGLAACRELLGRYGARLTAQPGCPGGAVLEFELPPAPPVDPAGEGEVAVADSSGITARSCPVKGVLVVDDEPGLREMLADVLSELGWDPLVAADAAQGLEMCVPGRCSVALVDYTLPDLSGQELAARLRKKDGQLAIVLMTGWTNEDVLEESCGPEIDLTARKPLSVGVIEELVTAGAALYIQRLKETAS